MNTLIAKVTQALSNVVLFAAGCVMLGLGFATVAVLALFALMSVGVALLASPFVGQSHAEAEQPADATVAA